MLKPPANYRPDVDGLRALCVLLVVVYHAGINLPGGFVGVDVFFVISGFVITRVVWRDTQLGQFSFRNFYARRFKRLIPAFMLVCIGTILMIRWFYLPGDYEDFAKSMRQAMFGLSNFYFFKETQGYFHSNAEMLPLIHTWSLSVEEQFYVVWPLLLLLLSRLLPVFRHPKYFIACLFLCLLGLSEYMAHYHAHAAYYLLPARAFELMLGGIAAINQDKMTLSKGPLANLLGLAGLGLIIGSAFMLSAESAFPGLNALWPCLGGFFIIWAGSSQSGLLYKILASRPVVFIGLISYSVYLWHWPPIALMHYLNIKLTLGVSLALIIGSFVMGALTYRFVETPTRHIKWPFWKVFVVFFLIPGGLIIGFYKFVKHSEGNPDRLHPTIQQLSEKLKDGFPPDISDLCYDRSATIVTSAECEFGVDKPNKQPDFLLIGDSHANSARGFFEVMAQDAGLKGLEISGAGSPLLLENNKYLVAKSGNELKPYFIERNRAIMKYIENGYKGAVVLAARWPYYVLDKAIVFDEPFEKAFADVIHALQANGNKVYIFLTVPEYKAPISARCLAIQSLEIPLEADDTCMERRDRVAIEDFYERQKKTFDVSMEITRPYKVHFIDPKKGLCDEEACRYIRDDGVPLYYNSDHLNEHGARFAGERYLKQYGNVFEKESDFTFIWK